MREEERDFYFDQVRREEERGGKPCRLPSFLSFFLRQVTNGVNRHEPVAFSLFPSLFLSPSSGRSPPRFHGFERSRASMYCDPPGRGLFFCGPRSVYFCFAENTPFLIQAAILSTQTVCPLAFASGNDDSTVSQTTEGVRITL